MGRQHADDKNPLLPLRRDAATGPAPLTLRTALTCSSPFPDVTQKLAMTDPHGADDLIDEVLEAKQ